MNPEREALLERYGRWYGAERFAIAFTSSTTGDDAKRVTTAGWDKTLPAATADFAAGLVKTRGQTRNVAIVLRPSNLVVLECDTEEDLVRIERIGLPQTITVRSSAPYKRHFYFRPPSELEHLPHVAFRFESGKLTADSGRYFLAPPSIHPSGAVYSFLPGLGPDETDIAELPLDIYDKLSRQASKESSDQRERITIDPAAKVKAGQRGDSVFRYASMLRRWGLDHNDIIDACVKWNDQRCDPPITLDRVRLQVAGAMKMGGDQEIHRALEHPTPDQDDETLVGVETWRQFADKSSQDIPCLINGLWPEASVGFIASPPKKGKTWLALSLALSVATGTPYLSRFDTPRARPVLYIALEGHRAALTHRLAALARGIGINPDDEIPNLHIAYKPRGINIAEAPWANYITGAAEAIGAELVIIDVLRAAALIRENSAEDFGTMLKNLAPLLDGTRSLALLHHFTKLSETSKERTPGERMSGSGAMYGAMDVGMFITGSDDGARTLRVEIEARDIASPDPIGIHLEGHGTGRNGGFNYHDKAWWNPTETPDQDDLDVTSEAIKEWLLDNGPASRGQIAQAFEISEKTVARREIRLLQMGVTATKKAGKPTLLSITTDNPQPQLDPGQDSLDTCPTPSVSNLNPSIQAKTGVGQDTPDTNPVSYPKNPVFAGIPYPGHPGLPTGEDHVVSDVPSDVPPPIPDDELEQLAQTHLHDDEEAA